MCCTLLLDVQLRLPHQGRQPSFRLTLSMPLVIHTVFTTLPMDV
jgi:hypothetical protein